MLLDVSSAILLHMVRLGFWYSGTSNAGGFADKANLGSFMRVQTGKIGTSWTKASDQFGSTHGQHKFEGTMPGDVGIAEFRERRCVFFCHPCASAVKLLV
jgi:hypothetical protein